MNTLADEFLADLGSDKEDDGKDENDKKENPEDVFSDDEQMEEVDNSKIDHPSKLVKLLGSDRLKKALEKIASTPRVREIVGQIEADPEYELIVEANSLVSELTSEITKVHKFLKEQYKKKFPELESVVYNPVDYARTINKIGNETDLNKVDLTEVLPGTTIMIVKVSYLSVNKVTLNDDELKIISDSCSLILNLDSAKRKIVEYVESRMTLIAPNLTSLVGSGTAAKMISLAGGLTNLSKMSAATIQTLGSTRKALGGLSTSNLRVNGFLADCDFVQKSPSDLRRKAVKLLSGKVCLASRVDSFHEDPSGAVGREFLDDVARKIAKILEPPPLKEDKPLPAPDDKPKKRRGGRKVRRMKQKYEMTDLRKQANRMPFGMNAQEEVGLTGETLGYIGMAGSGKVRVAAVDKGILNKKNKKFSGSSGTTNGLSSSLAFTPVQGIELVNPSLAAQRVRDANEKYFGTQSIIKKS